ncbi:MAG: hydrogen gas-evolving membrane-bound hydrogenase subunit E [Candidatus Omnitrophota bacterium]
MIEIDLLLIFMIIAALVAVQVKDLLSAVIAVGAVGIGLSLGFLVLKAPDLAIMQLVVEILSLIILIRATMRKDLPFSMSGRWISNTSATIAFLALFFVFAARALKDVPGFGNAAMRISGLYLTEAQSLGVNNIVSAITLNFRALDTLGEATVLFAAIVGVLAVARKIGYKKEN